MTLLSYGNSLSSVHKHHRKEKTIGMGKHSPGKLISTSQTLELITMATLLPMMMNSRISNTMKQVELSVLHLSKSAEKHKLSTFRIHSIHVPMLVKDGPLRISLSKKTEHKL